MHTKKSTVIYVEHSARFFMPCKIDAIYYPIMVAKMRPDSQYECPIFRVVQDWDALVAFIDKTGVTPTFDITHQYSGNLCLRVEAYKKIDSYTMRYNDEPAYERPECDGCGDCDVCASGEHAPPKDIGMGVATFRAAFIALCNDIEELGFKEN